MSDALDGHAGGSDALDLDHVRRNPIGHRPGEPTVLGCRPGGVEHHVPTVSEVVLGIVVIAALVLIFGLETQHRLGILIGVVSALLSAWFNIINAMLVKRGEPVRISFYEMGGAATLIGIYLWATNDLPPPLWELPASDIGWHLLLGLVCTSFAFVAGILVMRQLTPFTVMLTVNLEPIYTILIALLIWGSEEKMRGGSYLGIALIIACLFVNGWLQRRRPAAEVVEPDPLAQG